MADLEAAREAVAEAGCVALQGSVAPLSAAALADAVRATEAALARARAALSRFFARAAAAGGARWTDDLDFERELVSGAGSMWEACGAEGSFVRVSE